MQAENNEPIHDEPKKRKGIFFWLGRALLALMVLTFILVFLIHLPPVQRWGTNKISLIVSEKLNTRVSLRRFTFNPISDLTLKDIYIGSPDHPDDTLIYAENLYVDYRRIWDVFLNRMTIIQVGLDHGILNIHKIPGDTLTNLDQTLLRLLPVKKSDNPDFVLDLRSLNATSTTVRIDDEPSGTLINIFLKRADVEIDTLDLAGKYMSIGDLDMDEPHISVVNRIQIVSGKGTNPADNNDTWSFDIASWHLSDGKFLIDNQIKPVILYPIERSIDYAHMILEDVDISMDSLVIRGWDFKAKEIDMHLLHQNGFEINTLAANKAVISEDGIILEQLKIKTPESDIHNSISLLYSGYTDFKSFVDSVKLDVPSANIRLRVNDLLSIAPSLQKVEFFKVNADKDIFLQGKVSGHINRLKILDMHAGLGELSLTGDFRSRDLAVKGSQLLSMDLEKSAFSTVSLKSLFPKMKIPPILDKLGNVNFTGKFDGYPDDFVAYGTFRTELGIVTMDMNLNTVKGLSDGKFSGNIALQDFDLGAFTGQKDLGRITMSGRVIDGTGLTSESLIADITAQLTSLGYKGYTYHDARVDGHISGRLFNGTLDINDPNIDMHFEGFVDFRDSVPKLDFISRIDNINFQALGLTSDPITLQGIFNVDLTTGNLNEVSGTLFGEKINLTVNEIDYPLDSVQLIADIDTITGDRVYYIQSDLLSGMITGVFNPELLPNQLQHYLHEHYPRTIDLPKKPLTKIATQRLTWNLKVNDSEHWFDLAGLENLRIVNCSTFGTLNLGENKIHGSLDLPAVHYKNISAYSTAIQFEESNGTAELDLELVAADINESFFFEDVYITSLVTDDSMQFNFKTDQLADIFNELDLDITAYPEDGNWNISFNPQRLVMFGDDWKVPTGNKVEIRKDEFSLENFELVSGDRKIIIDDINRKGIDAYVTGFDISYLNELWINEKFDFSGLYTLDFEIDNLYDIQKMNAVLTMPAMKINNVPYGQWIVNASMDDPKDSVRINLAMKNEETSLTGEGAYLPPIKSIPEESQNYLRLGLIAKEFPLDFLEFLLGGNIRDTEGSVDMTLSLTGKTNKLNPNGKGKVFNGSTTIDYLGAGYSFHDQAFTITETMIDLSGTVLYDVMGNTAIVQGGLTHRYLRNLGLNATINSDKIVGLDVTSEENNIFYGMGIGSVHAVFSGTVANPTMVINITTAKGTHIYIPLSGGVESSAGDFVVFLENGMLPASTTTKINLSGINLTLIMSITEDAIVEIIFDDNTGEVLRGIGKGNLDLHMDRTGNFTMYGNYVISEGDYLFTNFIVRKPFELERDGVIRWEGDPYNAVLNVRAKYKDLTAPVYTLIQEYLTDQQGQAELINQAKERTQVDLTMILTGSLMHPDIAFDIDFPDLTGEIKGYANSKVATLKADENAMSYQVMGLLVTRSFLPSASINTGLLGQGLLDNTLSELISTTLSSYLGGLVSDLIPTGTFLTRVDFQIGLDLPELTGGVIVEDGEYEDPYATEVMINLPLAFFNDRLSVDVGGNYVTGATSVPTSEYFAGDITFEYSITPDRRLKIRAYNRNTLTVEGRKNKVGLGMAYRREYDTFDEFLGKKEKKKGTRD